MTQPVDPRWYESFFGEDWLALATAVPEERTRAQVDFVLEALAPKPDAAVLDLACGHGRHAIELARRGYRVTGIDISQPSLVVARERAGAAGVEVLFTDSDMRRIPFQDYFDAVINMYTAFGYLESDAEDQKVLDAVARALVPGGAFLIDTINPGGLAKTFTPRSWEALADGTLLLEDRTFDAASGRSLATWTFIHPDGSRSSQAHTLRCYTLVELAAMLGRAGLAVERAWGDFDGSECGIASRRLIVLARKP